MTSAMVIPSFSFSDLCIDGEWDYRGKDFMEFFTLPCLEVFGAGAWGPNQGWLPKLHGLEKKVKPTRTMLAALKLYDMWIWPAYCNITLLRQMEKIERKFGITEKDCKFVGYWEDEAKAVSGLPAGIKASYYVRPDKGALIYLANFMKKKRKVALNLDFNKWGMASSKVTDAENGREIDSVNGKLNFIIEGHDFRVIKIWR